MNKLTSPMKAKVSFDISINHKTDVFKFIRRMFDWMDFKTAKKCLDSGEISFGVIGGYYEDALDFYKFLLRTPQSKARLEIDTHFDRTGFVATFVPESKSDSDNEI